MLKRLTILCIGLILGTLLIASNAFCGTDDSGLQVYTLNFGEMMGETADVGQEDTKIAQYSYNMFQSGNGLCSYANFPIIGVELTGEVVAISDNFLMVDPIGQKCSVYYTTFTGLTKGTLITNDALIKSLGEYLSFSGLNKQYFYTGNHLISSTNSFITTSEVTIPTTSSFSHGALWQNRFWIANGYTLYYSAAQDYEDYTNSATKGGTTNIFGINEIRKIIGTRYGLYIFTDKGIFLQSGASKAWSIEKISDLIFTAYSITTLNDDIYFRVPALYGGRKIWKLSGVSVNVFCDIPAAVDSTLMPYLMDDIGFANSGRLLILANKGATGNSWIYDTQSKSWTRSSEYGFIDKNYYAKKMPGINKFSYFYLPNAEQFKDIQSFWTSSYLTPLAWGHKTAWMTLDGNASNRKEIDRIELDYLGGTTAVYLYYAYGTGTNPASSTTITAPLTTRFTTYVWNAPIGKQQSNRFYIDFYSNGTQTMTTNYVMKQIRIYYRNIGNYKTNTLR